MKVRYKITGGIFGFLAVAILALAVVLSHNAPCEGPPGLSGDVDSMKAIMSRCYGSTLVLEYEDVEKPVPAADEVLVKIHAASVNPLDWHYMRGSPYIMRLGTGLGAPHDSKMGVDFAGTIEAVGKSVTDFKPGDEVFGGGGGAFAQYLTIPADWALVMKPSNMTFEQAASVPIAGITALQALRDKGKIKPGQKVLINGASGGVGTFAVQIAKALGAEVTAVCSTRNVDLVRSIGADHVFDYKKEDYTQSGKSYDLIVDMVGNHSLLKNRRVLSPEGIFVIVGGPKGDWLGPLMGPISAMLLSPFVDQDFGMLLAQLRKDDLVVLADLMKAGKVTPVIDRHFSLSKVPEAIRYSEEGHTQGKIIINLD